MEVLENNENLSNDENNEDIDVNNENSYEIDNIPNIEGEEVEDDEGVEDDDEYNKENEISIDGDDNVIYQSVRDIIKVFIGNNGEPNDNKNFVTLDEEENRKVKKLIARIDNNLIEYNIINNPRKPKAKKIVEEANKLSHILSKIAPGEAISWKYRIICQLSYSPKNSMKSSKKYIFPNLEKAKHHGLSNVEYNTLTKKIANEFYKGAKKFCNEVSPLKDNTGTEYYTLDFLEKLKPYLRVYETCFELYKDPKYLKEAIYELCKTRKWITKDKDGYLHSTPQCGTFNAVRRYERLFERLNIYLSSEGLETFLSPQIELANFSILDEAAQENEHKTWKHIDDNNSFKIIT